MDLELSNIPPDVILQIATNLPRYSNPLSNALLNLALTSKFFFFLLSPSLYNSISTDNILAFNHHANTNEEFNNCLKIFAKSFRVLIIYDQDVIIQLPQLQSVRHLTLHFRPPEPNWDQCFSILRHPNSLSAPISAVNSFVDAFHSLTTLTIRGLIFCDEVLEGLTRLWMNARGLDNVMIGFETFMKTQEFNFRIFNLQASPVNIKSFTLNLSSLPLLRNFAIQIRKTDDLPQADTFLENLLKDLAEYSSLTEFSMNAKLNDSIYPLLIEYIANSTLETVRLSDLRVTDELAITLKSLNSLKDLNLTNLCCSKYILVRSPSQPASYNFKRCSLYDLNFDNDTANDVIECESLESLSIEDFRCFRLLYPVAEDLFSRVVEKTQFPNLRELQLSIARETEFDSMLLLILNTQSLDSFCVSDVCRIVVTEANINGFYDALEFSSIRRLEIPSKLVNIERLRKLLEVESFVEEILCESNIGELLSMVRTIGPSLNNQTLALMHQRRDYAKMYRRAGGIRLKFYTKGADQKLKQQLMFDLQQILESWDEVNNMDCIVLDEVDYESFCDVEKIIKTLAAVEAGVKVKMGVKDGEFCMYKHD
ncbi:hypothetical protein HK098_004488 [Nowakowskiella sp. JEL0407]|nr:hypothetical protein HK098_004488 [Nowakowskiella sp. JEL0407]